MLNTKKKKKKKKYYYFIFGLLNALNYIKFLQMTEQVIDIRDRIEKMRTQIDGSPQKSNHSQNKIKVSHANNLVPKESKDKDHATNR